MITMTENDSSAAIYEELKDELKIDPEKQTESRAILDGVVARARRG